MATILFVTWDGGGNLPPALGIAGDLRKRGNAIRFLGHEQQRAAIEGTGLAFEPYRHARPWSSAAQAGGLRGALTIFSMFTDRGPGADLLASLRREPADLVVIDCLLLGALDAADKAGLRRAVLVHTFYHFVAGPWSHGPIGIIGRAKGQHPARLWAAADAVLVATLAELDPVPPGRLPANAHYTGPVLPAAGRLQAIDGGDAGTGPTAPAPATRSQQAAAPLVLVSLSTTDYPGQRTVLQSILDALATLPIRAVVTTGPAVSPAQLRAPANAELHRYLPHEAVMPAASLVICHGGHATTMRALACGLPVLVIPVHPMLDQRMIGTSVQGQGAAIVLRKTASPGQIREAAGRMLAGARYRAAARRLGARIREHDAASAAADRLTALLPAAAR